METMASKGKPSPRSVVKPLSDEQVAKLAQKHHLVDPTHDFPTGPRKANTAEIEAQNPKATHRLLTGCDIVFRNRTKLKAWGIEHVPETGPFITAATHVTMFDVFVPMISIFHQGRRPRYMAKAEMASWPLIGKWFQLVGMQPVQRRSGKAKAIEETSIEILTSRPALNRMAGRHGDARPAEVADEHEKRRGCNRPRILAPTRLPDTVVLRGNVGCGKHQPLVAVAAQERGHVLRRGA